MPLNMVNTSDYNTIVFFDIKYYGFNMSKKKNKFGGKSRREVCTSIATTGAHLYLGAYIADLTLRRSVFYGKK